jgi:hypothetical protein
VPLLLLLLLLSKPLFLPFPFPLPLPLPLLLGLGIGGGGATCGHGDTYCCGGCRPHTGAEQNTEACSRAAEWSSSISSSSRSPRMVWKEGKDYDHLMKIFI